MRLGYYRPARFISFRIVSAAAMPARPILVKSSTGLIRTPSGPISITATGRPSLFPPPPAPPPPPVPGVAPSPTPPPPPKPKPPIFCMVEAVM
ncbi:MAG: hypothetical protein DCC49_01570 [Acidobacteria bacterium]|nr:MAG: hypothetical protein DCC49_01570 [Acidobacteriota bacterium]